MKADSINGLFSLCSPINESTYFKESEAHSPLPTFCNGILLDSPKLRKLTGSFIQFYKPFFIYNCYWWREIYFPTHPPEVFLHWKGWRISIKSPVEEGRKTKTYHNKTRIGWQGFQDIWMSKGHNNNAVFAYELAHLV